MDEGEGVKEKIPVTVPLGAEGEGGHWKNDWQVYLHTHEQELLQEGTVCIL